ISTLSGAKAGTAPPKHRATARRVLLLLAGNRLGRTLAGAGIGMSALTADRKAAAVAQATVIAQVHEALDVHRRVAAKIALDRVVAVDGLTNLNDFRVGQLVHAALGRDIHLRADFLGHLRADPMNILQCDEHALIRGDVDASNTSHAGSPKHIWVDNPLGSTTRDRHPTPHTWKEPNPACRRFETGRGSKD